MVVSGRCLIRVCPIRWTPSSSATKNTLRRITRQQRCAPCPFFFSTSLFSLACHALDVDELGLGFEGAPALFMCLCVGQVVRGASIASMSRVERQYCLGDAECRVARWEREYVGRREYVGVVSSILSNHACMCVSLLLHVACRPCFMYTCLGCVCLYSACTLRYSQKVSTSCNSAAAGCTAIIMDTHTHTHLISYIFISGCQHMHCQSGVEGGGVRALQTAVICACVPRQPGRSSPLDVPLSSM